MKGQKSGFTYLEIIVSVIILGIVITGSWCLLGTVNDYICDQRRQNQAANQAAIIMENLRLQVTADQQGDDSFAVADHQDMTLIGLDSDPFLGEVTSSSWSYRVEEDIQGNSECRIVTALVSWEE